MTNFEELGARLVACPHFRWMSGMRRLDGALCLSPDRSSGDSLWWMPDGTTAWSGHRGAIPDLAHAGTVGCLLQLVRRTLASPGLTTYLIPGEGWYVSARQGLRTKDATPTEAEALVAVLESRL